MTDDSQLSTPEVPVDMKKMIIVTIVGIILLGAVVYFAYSYSQKKGGGIALPGGTTYLGESPTKAPEVPVVQSAPTRLVVDPSVPWITYTGKIYPYSFSYPTSLNLSFFPGDGNDPVGINFNGAPPQQNILISIENIEKKDPKLVSISKEEYVKNWYKSYSGLKGVSKIEPITTNSGLKGYKAAYVNTAGAAPNIDVFLEIPGKPGIMVHLANGILDPDVFDKILSTVKWGASTPATPTKKL